MILRRFMSHFKEQNWFAVGLDVLVVIVGIFLGTQVNNWNENRQAQNRLDDYMQALSTEFNNSITMTNNHILWEANVMQGLRYVLDALEGETLGDAELQIAYAGLTNSNRPPPFPSKREILLEMQNNGVLQMLPHGDLRSALNEVMSQFRVSQKFYDRAVAVVESKPYSPEIITYELIPMNESRGQGVRRVISVNFEAARKDPFFRQRLMEEHTSFASVYVTNLASVRMDQLILKMLVDAGYKPQSNWLNDNIEYISPRSAPQASVGETS